MRRSGLAAGAAGIAAGAVAGVVAYQATTPAQQDPVRPYHLAAVADRPLPPLAPRVVRAPADCAAPARLEHGVCVTHVTRTVVIRDLPGAGSVPAPGVPAVGAPSSSEREPGEPPDEDGQRDEDDD